MNLEVIQQDIDKSNELRKLDGYDSACDCPIAQSAQRQNPGKKVIVEWNKLIINGSSYYTTVEMQEFMDDYDCNRIAKPKIFNI